MDNNKLKAAADWKQVETANLVKSNGNKIHLPAYLKL